MDEILHLRSETMQDSVRPQYHSWFGTQAEVEWLWIGQWVPAVARLEKMRDRKPRFARLLKRRQKGRKAPVGGNEVWRIGVAGVSDRVKKSTISSAAKKCFNQ